jgi:Na+-transporting methylmalonyl-CoA/oxaloacetate decarboxylase gamma subunit
MWSSAEWWAGFGLVFAVLGTIMIMFCWWMDRRIARFEAEDAEAQERPSNSDRSNIVEIKWPPEGG